jgi:hypothetical protein
MVGNFNGGRTAVGRSFVKGYSSGLRRRLTLQADFRVDSNLLPGVSAGLGYIDNLIRIASM